MKKNLLKRKNLIVVLLGMLFVLTGLYAWNGYQATNSQVVATNSVNNSNLTVYTLDQIAQFDGTDPNKPIYLVYEGYVYDVSAGREYYDTNGSYHYLAGTDATSELKIFGGDIIKKKYPIIGIVK